MAATDHNDVEFGWVLHGGGEFYAIVPRGTTPGRQFHVEQRVCCGAAIDDLAATLHGTVRAPRYRAYLRDFTPRPAAHRSDWARYPSFGANEQRLFRPRWRGCGVLCGRPRCRCAPPR